MSLIDILIILFVISSLFRGREIGFIRQLSSTIGFFGGLLLGAIVSPYLVELVYSPLSRLLVTVLVTLGTAMVFLVTGEVIGVIIKRKVLAIRLANRTDNILGSVLAAVSLLLVVWLSAAILVGLPYPKVQSAIRSSKIIAGLTRSLPDTPAIIADLSHIIDPNGFPEVFTGTEPAPKHTVLPSPAEFAAAVNRDQASVVKIEGHGCGGVVEGSGFVVGENSVVTNAHVVAGINHPTIIDERGWHKATAIWFDPDLDLAVLHASNLAGDPLSFKTEPVAAGTKGAVLGYPGGGDLTVKPAAILDEFTATGRNIYNQGRTERDVYSVQADIIPGNSGGPLIDVNGDVMGVIFATSTTYNHVGYALNVQQVITAVNHAESQNQHVSTGSCTE